MIVILLLILAMPPMIAAQPWYICGTRNYTISDRYGSNLDFLPYSVLRIGGNSSNLFAKGSTGEPPNTAYAVALCRGDLSTSSCSDCVDAAFQKARNLCWVSKDASIFDDKCTVSYSDNDIVNISSSIVNPSAVVKAEFILMNDSSEPMLPGWDAQNQQMPGNFTQLFETMLRETVGQALNTTKYNAGQSIPKYYAAIRLDTNGGSTTIPQLFCLGQCAPDLIEETCYYCLKNFSELAIDNFAGRQGGRVLGLRCNLRYNTKKFFTGPVTWSSGSSSALVPSPSPVPKPKKPTAKVVAIALVAPLLALFICIVVSCRLRRHRKGNMNG